MARRGPLNRRCLAIGLLVTVAVVARLHAQAPDPVAAAQNLYVSAAYEEALAVLSDATEPRARLYRALCLMALARTAEARATIEVLVRAAPSFVPDETDLPPRFLNLFEETRQEVLPQLVRDKFGDARASYQTEAYARAITEFQGVLQLLAEPAFAASPTSADYQLLSTAFIELSQRAIADIAAAAKAEAEARAAREREAARLAAIAARPPSLFVPPVPTRQIFPPWPATAGAPDLVVGRIRLTVDAEGHVRSASMDTPMSPQYDIRLIGSAHTWQYEPATLDGVPVEVEHVVEVRLSR